MASLITRLQLTQAYDDVDHLSVGRTIIKHNAVG